MARLKSSQIYPSTSGIEGDKTKKFARQLIQLLDETNRKIANSLKYINAEDIITKGPWIDVRAYGAVGDGTTDDTAAIQAAFDSVSAAGSTVIIPPGTWTVDGELTLPDFQDFTVRGIGKPTIDVSGMGSGEFLFTMINRQQIITGMRIIGSSRNTGGIRVNTSAWSVTNMLFNDLEVGMSFDAAHDSLAVDSLVFFDNALDLFFGTGVQSSNTLTHCWFLGGEKIMDLHANTVLANIGFTNCGFAAESVTGTKPMEITLNSVNGLYFKGCRFENDAKNDDIKVYNLWIKGLDNTFPAQNISIEECYFTGPETGTHIHIEGRARAVTISGNWFTSDVPNIADIDYTSTIGHAPVIQNNQTNENRAFLIDVTAPIPQFTDSDTTPSALVNDGNVFRSNTSAVTITRFDNVVAGQEFTIISGGATRYDTSAGTRLKGSSANIQTLENDITTWVCLTGGTTSSVCILKGWVDISQNNTSNADGIYGL